MKYVPLGLVLVSLTSTAQAQWLFEPPSEGVAYAFATDGGFIDGSYQNGMMFSCPDLEGHPCEMKVTINGRRPEARTVVNFKFPNGEKLQRITETIGNGEPQVGWDRVLIDRLRSESSVTVSLGDNDGHTFSLRGSSQAIGRAMGDTD